MFRLLPDFLVLLSELLRHCCHMRSKLCFLRLECLYFRPIRHLDYLLENIPWTTVAQCPAHSAGDVFHLRVLVLKVGQFRSDSLEGVPETRSWIG